MVLRHTPKRQDGLKAPDFTLKNINDSMVSLQNCMGEGGLVVMFICNHCPYVIGIIDRLVSTCDILQANNIGCAAIMSNDAASYPDDSFDNMKIFAKDNNFSFPYLIDETQDIAKAYGAVCTPDFFGFDSAGILQYRGRLDSSANKLADENTVPELLNAMEDIKGSGAVSASQNPSMGCSIKWRN